MHEWTPGNKLIRLAIALVWLYQGFWCKVLGGVPRHEAVIAAVPFIGSAAGRSALIALGLLECGIGLWVLSGRWMRQVAIVQMVREPVHIDEQRGVGLCVRRRCSETDDRDERWDDVTNAHGSLLFSRIMRRSTRTA